MCSIANTSAEEPSGRSSTRLSAIDSAAVAHPHRRCSERRAEHAAFASCDTEADESSDGCPQLGPLLVVEIRHAQDCDVVALPHHEHGIDDLDVTDIAQPSQLFGDATFE